MSGREHEVRALLTEYQGCLKSFIPKRKKTIELLQKIYEALNCHSKTGNIAEITGAGVGIVGSTAILAALFTGGLGLVAVGTALALGGAVTGIGAGVTVHVLEERLIDESNKIRTDDDEASKRVNQLSKKISVNQKEVVKGLDMVDAVLVQVATKVRIWHFVAKFILLLTGVSLRRGVPTAGKVAKIAGPALFRHNMAVAVSPIVAFTVKIGRDVAKFISLLTRPLRRVVATAGKVAKIAIPALFLHYMAVAVSSGVAFTVKIGHNVAKFISLLTRAPLWRVVATAGKVAKIAGPALEVIAIPLNIWLIVDSAQSLSKDSEKATRIRKIIEELKGDLKGKEELVC